MSTNTRGGQTHNQRDPRETLHATVTLTRTEIAALKHALSDHLDHMSGYGDADVIDHLTHLRRRLSLLSPGETLALTLNEWRALREAVSAGCQGDHIPGLESVSDRLARD